MAGIVVVDNIHRRRKNRWNNTILLSLKVGVFIKIYSTLCAPILNLLLARTLGPIVGVGAKLIADKLFKARTVPPILDMVLATRALKVLGGYFYPPLAQFLVTLP